MQSRLRALIRLTLIIEGRKDDVKAQFPDVDVEALAANDPSGNFKYLKWMAKQVAAGVDSSEVFDVVKQFHSVVNRMTQRDINRHTMDSIRGELEALSGPSKREKKGRTAAAKNSARDAGKLVYEDSEISVFYMSEPEACVYYGRGTTWCIASSDGGAQAWNNYRSDEDRDTQFYFVIRKQPKGDVFDKVAIDYPTFKYEDEEDDFMSKDDRPKPIFFNAADDEVSYRVVAAHIPTMMKIMHVIEQNAPDQPTESDRILKKYGLPKRVHAGMIIKLIAEKGESMPRTDMQFLAEKYFSYGSGVSNEIQRFLEQSTDETARARLWSVIPRRMVRMLAKQYLNDQNPQVQKLAKIAYAGELTLMKGPELEATIKSYVESPDPDIRAAATESWRITEFPQTLEKLTYDESTKVRAAATLRYISMLDQKAGEVPVEEQRRLAFDPDPEVRRELAQAFAFNVKTAKMDFDIMRTLAKDDSSNVRRAVMSISMMPDDVLGSFETDPDEENRVSYVRFIRPPMPVLQRMATSDPSKRVRDEAMKSFESRRNEEV